jgi:ATP-dependent RNA helicase SUPV3L1/SUV3
MILNINDLSQSLSIKKTLLIPVLRKLQVLNKENEYYEDSITEDIFNELNPKITYDNYRKILKNLIEDRIYIELENAKLLEEKKQKEIEIDNLSKLLSDKLESIWFPTKRSKFILHIGPTNSGKTYNCIEAIKNSKGDCAYLSPLRLLAHEIFEKLNSCDIKTSLITGEDRVIVEGANVVSSTIEMLNYKKKYDIVVVDECFMITDNIRGKSWLKTILEVKSNEVHLISNLETKDTLIDLLTRLNQDFEVKEYFRKVPLVVSDSELQLNSIRKNKNKNKILFVVFSRLSVLYNKHVIESISDKNCSILYGNLPPEVKKEQMRRFIDGETDYCVSTDVVGMGLNMPCDIVCFMEIEKFDGVVKRPLNKTEVAQIGGRAGRFGLSDKGTITALNTNSLKYIRKVLDKEGKNKSKIYFGLTYEIFHLLEGDYNNRILNFKKLEIIPTKFEDLVSLQNVTEYTKLLMTNHIHNIKDDKKVWILINLPVKENNASYFNTIVKCVYENVKIPLVELQKKDLTDNRELENCEQQLSKLDLYLCLSNYREVYELLDIDYLQSIQYDKEILIMNINKYLLDKKKMNSKFCQSCGVNVGIEWKHKNCDDCHGSNDEYGDW